MESQRIDYGNQVVIWGLLGMRDVDKQIRYERDKGYQRVVSLTHNSVDYVLVMER